MLSLSKHEAPFILRQAQDEASVGRYLKVKRRTIPACGLEVSLVGLGCNNFAGRSGREETRAVIDKALEVGITFFDTSDSYPPTGPHGASEEFMGEILGPRRKDVVLATKFGSMLDKDPNRKGASRRYIMRAVEDSLRRLRTDWIDLYQLHRPDAATPIDETLRALDDLIRQGKVRYVGCSNFAAWQIVEAELLAKELGINRFVSCQNEYSLLRRDPEAEVLPVLQKYGMGFLPFFPLASGILTGKYQPGKPAPQGTRLSGGGRYAEQMLHDDVLGLADRLKRFAEERGHTILELAMSWLASKPVIWSIIAGATKPDQVEQNAKAADWSLTAQDLADLDVVLKGNR
jgi:aryl-alcohol dehydrogenase-like predicted oxidoreductase